MVSMQDFSSLDPSSSAHHCVVFLGKTLLSLSVLLQTRVKHLGTSKISENSDTALVRINILTSCCKPLGLQPLTVSGISLLPYPQDIKIDNPNSFFSIFIINKIHKKPLPYLSQKKIKNWLIVLSRNWFKNFRCHYLIFLPIKYGNILRCSWTWHSHFWV